MLPRIWVGSIAAAVLALTAGWLQVPGATATTIATGTAGTTGGWTAWRTSPYDAGTRLAPATTTDRPATRVLELSPDATAQTWLGVGAALTDASTGILQGDPDTTRLLFDPTRDDGAHLNLVRLPLSATDFSTTPWVYGLDPGSGALIVPDAARASAALLTESVVPMRRDLQVVATPWTAPASMKISGSLNGGALRDADVPAYGELMLAEVDWLRAQHVPLRAVTLANEPYHSTTSYPTMTVSDEQQAALATSIAPDLGRRGVQLWAVDHNWSDRSHYDAVQTAAPDLYAASAFHCYGGTPEQMAGVSAPPIVTECTGTTDGYPGTFWWDAHQLVADAIDAGSTGLMMWNLALREDHGPHTGGCGTCRGVVDVDSGTGAVTRGPEFYTLAHLARAADPGAVVIGRRAIADTPYAAFANPDGALGIVGHNDTSADQVVQVSVDGSAIGQRFLVGPGDLFTLRGPTPTPTPTSDPVPDPTEPTAISVQAPGRVTGRPHVGATLRVSGWQATPTPTVAYRWLRDGAPIRGARARGPHYVVTRADRGSRLGVHLSLSAEGYADVEVVVRRRGRVGGL